MSPRLLLASTALALAAAGAAGPRPLAGQDVPLVVEARGGLAIPVASFRTGPERGGTIDRGPSFGVHFVYRGPSGWGPYVGFDQQRFDCADDGCPAHEAEGAREYVATSWDLGMQRTLARFGWLRAGLLFGRLERDVPSGPGVERRVSSLGLGVEGGGGVRVPVRGRVTLTPGLRFGWLNTRFRDGPLLRMRWVTADVGVGFGF